jgi:hypothetical protein
MPAEQERNEGGVEWTSTLVESGTAASYPWLLACAIAIFSVSIRKCPVAGPVRSGQVFYRTAPEHPLMVDVRHPERYLDLQPADEPRAGSREASGPALYAILTATVNHEVHGNGIGIFSPASRAIRRSWLALWLVGPRVLAPGL